METLCGIITYTNVHSEWLTALSTLIMAMCSFVTLILAIVVYINSKAHSKDYQKLIDDLKVGLIMVATIRGGAKAGKRQFNEYKAEFSENQNKN